MGLSSIDEAMPHNAPRALGRSDGWLGPSRGIVFGQSVRLRLSVEV